ncbi:hypothetical protein COV20_06250 [Candidatus Woesearchaeota archaeon CG10_big_fil_rev_8_21_14_0_10_45_16]|nr:MAG: hypothetical protein COV20_06250 [Candidatus Woesearchaeota archaeon CG10_big_fil_rev_8_21_14_0_10_45_16]
MSISEPQINRIMHLDLEHLVDALGVTKPYCRRSLDIAGEYLVEEQRILYNPDRIVDEEDFLITILHEIVHHYDEESLLSEEETEQSALYNLQFPLLRDYLRQQFASVIQREWTGNRDRSGREGRNRDRDKDRDKNKDRDKDRVEDNNGSS